MNKTEEVKVSARIPRPLHARAKVQAIREEKSLDALINEALEKLLEQRKTPRVNVA